MIISPQNYKLPQPTPGGATTARAITITSPTRGRVGIYKDEEVDVYDLITLRTAGGEVVSWCAVNLEAA